MSDGTPLTASSVFQIVSLCNLQVPFKAECFREKTKEELDFDPSSNVIYSPQLGVQFLKKHNLPTTVEQLREQERYMFDTLIPGKIRYMAGDFFMIYPDVVRNRADLIDTAPLLIEVLGEFELPSDLSLESPTENIHLALASYVQDGLIKIHEVGVRMFQQSKFYKFQQRFTKTK